MVKRLILYLSISVMVIMSCNSNVEPGKDKDKTVHLVTLDPGHFHAALVQKTMYDDVDPVVHVYAPAGNDLQLHLDRIKGFLDCPYRQCLWCDATKR